MPWSFAMGETSITEIERLLVAEVASILSIDPRTIAVDAPLHSLGMSSMAFVELLVVIEKTFDLRLMETDLTKEDFQAIRSLASCIHRMT
jgi:acyl carrier protein